MNPYFKALRAIDRRDFAAAIACLDRAVQFDHRDSDAYARRGWAHWQRNETELALSDLHKALALDPEHVLAQRYRGAIERGTYDDSEHDLPDAADHEYELIATSSFTLPTPASSDESRPAEPRATLSRARWMLSYFRRWKPSSGIAWSRAGAISMVVHALLLFAMGMIVIQAQDRRGEEENLVVSEFVPPPPPHVKGSTTGMDDENLDEKLFSAAIVPSIRQQAGYSISVIPAPVVLPSAGGRLDAPELLTQKIANQPQLAGDSSSHGLDLLHEVKLVKVPELAKFRTPEVRLSSVMSRGGTMASETAVEKALQWLARHQCYDGGWNFDHRSGGDCRGKCSQPGALSGVRVGATGLALLPFLGAGHTHKSDKYGESSPYQRTVKEGLRFIVQHVQRLPLDGSLTEPGGRMYDHAIATIALCEAYAMTQDRELARPATRALQFIVASQDPVGGGWRYQPGMPGDTSVVVWFVLALKSGHLAYLKVPLDTVRRASAFLDYVQQDEGAAYGYFDRSRGTAATTSAGLLCRMNLGWKRDNPALQRGVTQLSEAGPSLNDMYYNYYATQVLHHYEGPLWQKWNEEMRDYLVDTQDTDGHEAGSWFFDDPHCALAGGRLYNTAMAAMTLEVYYRHMPLYSEFAAKDNFGRAEKEK